MRKTVSLRLRLYVVMGLATAILLPLGMALRSWSVDCAEQALRSDSVRTVRDLAAAALRVECRGLERDLLRYAVAVERSDESVKRKLQAEFRLDTTAIFDGDLNLIEQRSVPLRDDLPDRHVKRVARDLSRSESRWDTVTTITRIGGSLALVAVREIKDDRELLAIRWLGAKTLESLSVRTGVRFVTEPEGGDPAWVSLDLQGIARHESEALFLRLPPSGTEVIAGVREASSLSLRAFACLLFLVTAGVFELVFIARLKRLRRRVELASAEYSPVCEEFVDGSDELASLASDLCKLAENQRGRLARAKSIDEARSAFLANMNYAIRTPMTAILGYGERLANTNPEHANWAPAAHAIEQGCRDLLRTLDDILDLAKYEAGQVQIENLVFQPRVITSDVAVELTGMASSRGSTLEVSVGHDVPEQVVGDPTLIYRCLVHLVEYAVRATERGRIVATLRIQSIDTMAPRLVFEVCDTGVGMSAPDCDRIFDAFELADPSGFSDYGNGLALAIAKRTAQVLAGSLEVVTAIGRGTQFTLSLPVRAAMDFDDCRVLSGASDSSELDGLCILVVDDARDNRRLLGRMLERVGCTVVEAGDGREACVLALSSDLVFDLILMDLQMPGIDGFEATRRLRDRGCEVPIIALSADGELATKQLCQQVGCNEFLKKPVPSLDLMRTIVRCLSSAAAL